MGAMSSLMGGAASAMKPSSSASSGPSASGAGTGTTGNLALNFGGINLGNQDIPLTDSSTASTNQAPTIGTVPSIATAVSTISAYLPYVLLIGAGIALYIWIKKH